MSAVQRKHGTEISDSGLPHARMLANAGSRGRGGCIDGEERWEEAELGEVQEGLWYSVEMRVWMVPPGDMECLRVDGFT